MILFPAIDLKDGAAVRLLRGEMGSATVFNPDPAAQAREFAEAGFAWLHLVFGHFAMAPMYQEVFGQDPLSPEGLARQTRFLRKVADLMMNASDDR